VDLLLSKSDLTELWKDFPGGNHTRGLFEGGEDVWDLGPLVYMRVFLAPFPEANFRSMIISSAGHWTLPGFKDESDPSDVHAYSEVLYFYKITMNSWTKRMANSLNKAKQDDEAMGITRAKERHIILRGYNTGHDNCNTVESRIGGPLDEYKDSMSYSYNWGWIRKMNRAFEVRELLSPL